ncbi:hypothetical protein [Paludisphaera rhizosphaerae]|uniref:hypothetical protein n=1 Tax=Paludisphaera rhizosphaerae TaxID=2711216 RepID=UPI0013EAA7E4|nr:hypothetical protein [Paludisphaera rhizosphaerae]
MDLTFECSQCRMIDHVDGVESAPQAFCSHCRTGRDLAPGSFDAVGRPTACPLCASADLYVLKDFPQEIGLAIVLAGFAVSLVVWYYGSRQSAYLALGASVLLDLVFYRLMPDAVVCYRCGSQLRGPGVNRGRRFRWFDPAVANRYRREPSRAEESKSREASVEPGGTDPAGGPMPDAT